MKFTYSIKLEDLQNAQELHWHQTLRRRAFYYGIYWLTPVLLSALAMVWLSKMGLFLQHWPVIVVFFIGFLTAAVITTVSFPYQKARMHRRRFEKNFPPHMRTAWCLIDANGISSAIIGTDEEQRRWRDVVNFAQNDEITLLYLSEKKFMFIPTNAFSTDQRAELLGYVERHFRNRSSC